MIRFIFALFCLLNFQLFAKEGCQRYEELGAEMAKVISDNIYYNVVSCDFRSSYLSYLEVSDKVPFIFDDDEMELCYQMSFMSEMLETLTVKYEKCVES